MAADRFNATVQFPSEPDYLKLKALAILMDKPIGEAIQYLVDADAEKHGLKVGVWDNPPTKPQG